MKFSFIDLYSIFKNCQKPIIDFLYDYDMLNKWSNDVKKTVIYFLLIEIDKVLKDKNVLIFIGDFYDYVFEITEYYSTDSIKKLLNDVFKKIGKLTKRTVVLKKKVPSTQSLLSELDGELIDQILLLKHAPINQAELKKYLHSNRLKSIFNTIY